MANVQFLCPKVILVHQNSTVGEEKEHNQQSCNSEDTFDILKKPKALNVKVSIANASNSKISSYSEKLLPFNKRKSQYYVWQEGESVVPTTEDNSCPGNEMDWTEKNVKIRSLRTIICLFLSHIYAQTIAVGSSLTATPNKYSSWHSPSDIFAFGFHPLESNNNNNNNNLFLLAIWYVKIPDTIVWHANNGKPVPEGSTVTLTADAGLVLNDLRGARVWHSQWNGTFVVSSGFMNDSGNFILRSSDTNASVWESFQHPTDTLLPGQIVKRGGVLNSRVSDQNYTNGRFELRLQYDGNLVLNTRDLTTGYRYTPYYASDTYQPPNQGYRLIYSESGRMYITAENGTIVKDFSTGERLAPSDYYQRATLNVYGVWAWYYVLIRTTTNTEISWSVMITIPPNICTSPANDDNSVACGFNSICSFNGSDNQRPTCSCPLYYSLLDSSDSYGSCKPDFKQQFCDEHDSLKGGYHLVSQQNTDWPSGDYAQLQPSSEVECKTSCLNDCLCAVAVYGAAGNGTCWKKKLPLLNGRESSDLKRVAWLKVPNDSNSMNPFAPIATQVESKNNLNQVITVLLGGSVFFNFALLTAIILGIFLLYNKNNKPQRFSLVEESGNVHCFNYQALEEATDGFSQEIGRGAFGVVYKGEITTENSQNIVAVKKLERLSTDTDREFKTEVNVIGKTHHKNLVHLVGYCKEEEKRLLVYEYMSNGTLADYLFGDLRPSWIARVQIAEGIARGLLYLHEECSTQIIHCDIKPQNILLDDYHRVRIADFGLAKLLIFNQTHTNTAIRGTKGYVAPEWFRNKPITVKVDVYSFGILLLEIICCRKNVCLDLMEEEAAILTDHAFDCYHSNTEDTLVMDDAEAIEDFVRWKRFLMVALWCVQENPSLRPTMRMVTQMLDGLAQVLDPPCPTSFSITNTV